MTLGGDDFDLATTVAAARVKPGQLHSFTIGLINMSPGPRNYDLRLSSRWPAFLAIMQVNGLQSSEVGLIPVQVTVPLYAPLGEVARVTVLATDRTSGAQLRREITISYTVNLGAEPRTRRMLPSE